MYPDLVKAFQAYCPALKFCDTHCDPAYAGYVEIKPDISRYHRDSSSAAPEEPAENQKLAAVNLEEVEIIVEVKIKPGDDAFADEDGRPFEVTSTQGRDTRGQITMYAIAQLADQHRTHCFSVLVVGTYARLVRWDRAGAVVTSKFSYTRTPWLATFLHRYNYANAEVRGIDTSVYRLDNFDDKLIQSLKQVAREMLEIPNTEPLYVFEIYDNTTGNTARFIGSRPCTRKTGYLTGRCTRCYKVYNPQSKDVQFMKDTWGVAAEGVLEEATVYSKLRDAGVRNILRLVAAGDVRHRGSQNMQNTKTQDHAKQRNNRLESLRHCRLVFEECGKSLRRCETVGDMICVMRDAIIAHKDAYEKAKILHRDVSYGNIIMLWDGKGVLIDWDLAKSLDDPPPCQIERNGT
ncbi:hypothetical protein E1B28_012695 [Marasmius oreades]|uniref:Fungal-type protein kinase domain-containing protein n=1 Tax=Marasmius oreades TaxID=181124 RepID=A0A9P7UNI7_9AGAR|nr:uncharacterized protein E1B28_012695 [Marasmius oreades]KAG7088727.1 hypothetical protein E1B28_012695 [Marasmius oreades]